jgi:hypothetical protein
MRSRLRFILAAAFLAASSIPAAADPISVSILAVLSIEATATAVAITTFIITTAATYALSAAASALNGGKRSAALQEANTFGIKTTLQSGGTVSRAWGFGLYMTAGSEAYPARTWGQSGKTPNAYFTRFIALSDLPVDALNAVIVDDQLCTYGSGSPDANLGYAIPEYNSGGADHLWVKFYDGSQTAADAWAVSQFGSDPDYPYGSDQVGYGVAYVIVTALIEQTLFSSFPQFKFELQGAKLFDPRADTTVGGSGSQRWATPSTWAYTTNPSVVKYNVLRGISWSGQWLYGLQGTSSGRMPLDSWFAAMNVDDASVESSPGVFEAQYRCGGEVVVSSQPSDLLDELNKCDNGRIAEAGGIFKTRSGGVGSAVMSFTDKDLIVTEAKTFDPFPGLETTVNGITATYPDPTQNWVMTDAPALYDSALEAEDGDRRLVISVPYNFVPYQSQVQRLMQSSRDEARKFRKHVAVAPPTAFALEALDIISWTSAENGYLSKLFTVVPTDQDNLDQGLALLEVDPADYDWDPSTDYRTYTPVPIVSRAPASQAMSGWSVAGETITGTGGRAKPGIRISWGTSGIADVDGILYQIRRAADSVLILAGETDHFSEGTLVVSENLSSATNYEARGKYRPANANRETSWSSWLSVTTPDVRISAIDIADGSLTALKFAAGITQVQVVSSLASATAAEGNTAVLTTDGKLYRYHSGAWTAAVPAVDISGTINAGQIAAGAVDITKFAAGLTTVEIVSTLPTTGNFEGRTVVLSTDGKLYRYHGSAFTAAVPSTDITGTLTDAQLAAIAAAKVTGQITTTQITNNAITTGKLATGAVTANEIAANTITAAKIAAATITATELSAGAVTTPKLAAGAVTANEIAANTITAAKIAAGAIGATQIAAGAISASKMFIGSTDNLFLDGACKDITYWSIWNSPSMGLQSGFGGTWVNDSAVVYSSTASSFGGIFGARGTSAIACQPGDQFAVAAIMGTNGYYADLSMSIEKYNSVGTDIGTDLIQSQAHQIGGPVHFGGFYTVPAGVSFIGFFFSSDFSTYGSPGTGSTTTVTLPIIRRRASGSLIVDGAITASKIGAGEIVAGKIASGAVTAGTIAANAVTAGKIDADAVTAGAIAAGAVNATAIIVSDIVVTGHLTANSVTNANVAVGSSTLIGTSDTALVALTLTTTGGDVLLSFTDYNTWSTAGPRGFYSLYRDAVKVMEVGFGGGSCPDYIFVSGSGLDSPSANTYVYRLYARYIAGNQPTSQNPSIIATELKR